MRGKERQVGVKSGGGTSSRRFGSVSDLREEMEKRTAWMPQGESFRLAVLSYAFVVLVRDNRIEEERIDLETKECSAFLHRCKCIFWSVARPSRVRGTVLPCVCTHDEDGHVSFFSEKSDDPIATALSAL